MPARDVAEYRYVELWHSHSRKDCDQLGLPEISPDIGPPHDHNGERDTYNSWWWRAATDDVEPYCELFSHWNIFTTLNFYARDRKPDSEQDNLAFYDVGLDFDSAGDVARAVKDAVTVGHFLEERGVQQYRDFIAEFSGSKGVAIRLPHELFGQEPLPALTGYGNHIIGKTIAEWIAKETGVTTLDMRVFSKRRQWRLTSTRHSKTGLWRTQLDLSDLEKPLDTIREWAANRQAVQAIDRAAIDPNRELAERYQLALEAMVEKAAEKKNRKQRSARTKDVGVGAEHGQGEPVLSLEDQPPCVEEAIDVGISDTGLERGTNRNDATLQLACFYKDAGVSKEEATDLLVAHAQQVLKPFSWSDEAAISSSTRSCVSSVYDNPQYGFSCGGMKSAGFKCDPACPLYVPDGLDLGVLAPPPGYRVTKNGVFVLDETGAAPEWVPVVRRPLWIEDRLRDEMGNIKLVLRCDDRKFYIDREAAVIRRKMADALANLDLPVTDLSTAGLVEYLVRFEETNRHRFPNRLLATRCGWHGERFVLPGLHADIHVQPLGAGEQAVLTALRSQGDLSEVRRVIDLVRPSPIAMTMLWASMAAPWLTVVGCPNFIVHVWNDSTAGKTVGQKVAASPWGDPSCEAGLVYTWNTTSVGLEYRAHFLSGLPFCLSEVKAIKNDTELARAIYMLCEGRGRVRGARQGGTRQEVSWRTIVLSTGEVSLSSCSAFQGIPMRCLELYGNVLGHLSGEQVVEIENTVQANFGLLGRQMVETMMASPALVRTYKNVYDYWRRRLAEVFPGPFGHRMTTYAAVIALGGSVLHDWILEEDYDDQIFEVISGVLRSEAHEKSQPYAERALAVLDSWVTENAVCFGETAGTRYGKFINEGVAVLPSVLERACKELGLDYSRVVRDFDDRNWLVKQDGRRQKNVRLGDRTPKCFVITEIKRMPLSERVPTVFPQCSQ